MAARGKRRARRVEPERPSHADAFTGSRRDEGRELRRIHGIETRRAWLDRSERLTFVALEHQAPRARAPRILAIEHGCLFQRSRELHHHRRRGRGRRTPCPVARRGATARCRERPPFRRAILSIALALFVAGREKRWNKHYPGKHHGARKAHRAMVLRRESFYPPSATGAGGALNVAFRRSSPCRRGPAARPAPSSAVVVTNTAWNPGAPGTEPNAMTLRRKGSAARLVGPSQR